MVFALILVVNLKRIVGDLIVHGGTEENCCDNIRIERRRRSHPDTERRYGFPFGVE